MNKQLNTHSAKDAFAVKDGEISINEARTRGGLYEALAKSTPKGLRKAKSRPKEFRQSVALAKIGMTKGIHLNVEGQDVVALPASVFLLIAQTLDML